MSDSTSKTPSCSRGTLLLCTFILVLNICIFFSWFIEWDIKSLGLVPTGSETQIFHPNNNVDIDIGIDIHKKQHKFPSMNNETILFDIPSITNVFNWTLYDTTTRQTILIRKTEFQPWPPPPQQPLSQQAQSNPNNKSHYTFDNTYKINNTTHFFQRQPFTNNLRFNSYLIKQPIIKLKSITNYTGNYSNSSSSTFYYEKLALVPRIEMQQSPWIKESNDSNIPNVLFTLIEKNAMTKMRTFLKLMFANERYQLHPWNSREKLSKIKSVNQTIYCQTSIFNIFEKKLKIWKAKTGNNNNNNNNTVTTDIFDINITKLHGLDIEEYNVFQTLSLIFKDPAWNPSSDMMVHYLTKHVHRLGPKTLNKYLNVMRNMYSKLSQKKWIKLIILRDPIERLLSAFVDKCINDHRHYCEGIEFPYESKDQLENFSYIKQFGIIEPLHCQLTYLPKIIDNNAKIELFNQFVNHLYEKVITHGNGRYYWKKVNIHYKPQIFDGFLYHLIEYFDYIIIYNKNTFSQDIFFIVDQILNKKYKVINDTDRYWNHWGYFANESLFETKTEHTHTIDVQSEIKLLKRYYSNINTLKLAIELYKFDYMLLPFQYPPKVVGL